MFYYINDANKKKIYKEMWEENDFVKEGIIEKSKYGGDKESDNSYAFKGNVEEDNCKALERIFNIPEEQKSTFGGKYNQATSGAGQEERRIMTLHSSSLCALLFFHNISNNNPLILNLDEIGQVKFTESVFEYQNKVTDSGGPSNVDVTLLGECKGKKVVLFLESKFSEYITGRCKTLWISKKYLLPDKNKESEPVLDYAPYSGIIYNDDFWEENKIKIDKGTRENEFALRVDKARKTEAIYLSGLKQMVSHYVGVRRFADGLNEKEYNKSKNFYYSDKSEKEKIQKHVRMYAAEENAIVLLGAIAFDVPVDERKPFISYKKIYEKLTGILNKELDNQGQSERIKIIPQLLTYQDIFKDNSYVVDRNVRRFYFGEL